ncbi:MAG: tetratricopeptide repeat protein [Deltaproteobacteria bacterium]|nr:MAG: tetratricopeptide repeat protein [Deltaproteobacteria bacterium]
MFTVMFRLAVAGALLVAVPTCSGGETIVKTVKRDPKQKTAKQLVTEARDQANAGKLDQADRSYGEAYANAAESPKLAWEILQEWVDFLIHAGRTGRAVAVAKQYYGDNPAEGKGYALYADALLAANKPQEALGKADELVQLSPDDPRGYDCKGRALVMLERMDEGVEVLRKAVQLDASNAKYHMALGSALHQMGDVNKAALEFRSALKNAPDDPEAHVLLGMALRDQSEFEESKTYLDKAIELDPRNGRAYFELGVLYNKQLKQAEAQAAFGNAVKYAPNESRFWYAYGEIYRVQDQFDDAIRAYRRSVELEPPFPKAMGKLGGAQEPDELLVPRQGQCRPEEEPPGDRRLRAVPQARAQGRPQPRARQGSDQPAQAPVARVARAARCPARTAGTAVRHDGPPVAGSWNCWQPARRSRWTSRPRIRYR